MFWVFGNRFCSVIWFFFEFLIPYTLGGLNNLISNPFLTIFSMSDVPRGVLVLLGCQKQRTFPLDLACPGCLSVHPLTVLPYYGIVKPIVLGKVPGEAVKGKFGDAPNIMGDVGTIP